MIIYVPEELKDLKLELKNKGYNISNNLHNHFDAIICNVKNGDLKYISNECNLVKDGTLIIDYGSRNIDEIDNILNNKTFN